MPVRVRVLVLDPALPALVLEEPAPVPGALALPGREELPAELALVPLDGPELGAVELGAGEVGADDLTPCDADGLALCDADAEVGVLDLGAWLGGGGVVLAQVAVPVTVAFSLFVALRLAGAGTVVRAAPVEVPVTVGGTVTVLVTVGVTVTVWLGLAPPVGGAVVLPAGVLGAEPAGGTLDVTDLVEAAFGEGDGDVAEHGFTARLLWPAVLLPGPVPPFDEFTGLVPVPAGPAVPCVAPGPVLLADSPVALPIWTRASRVGGSARATPMANTAHAIARAGRSSPSRQSLGCCRADPSPSRPSRQVVQRRVIPARKPPAFPARACSLA